MTFYAVLEKTTTDEVKSKSTSPQNARIILEAYMNPHEFADLITQFFDKSFEVTLKEVEYGEN